MLLLSKVIERGFAGTDRLSDDNILAIAPKETLEELNAILMHHLIR